MGVHGLWKLLEPAGKPVPVETLENKVLAVDVSIWLHQLVKGFQDSTGSSLPNAHLLGLYHRICKLLFFKIKPVFVFDGGVPVLKRRTMAARQNQKSKAELASERLREQLLKNLLKQKAVNQVLEEIRGEKTSPQKKPDMFELPPIAEDNNEDSELEDASSSSSEDAAKEMRYRDLHSIDVNSRTFKALPADIRHDILTELKETRKQSSWGRLHEMPEELSDFSSYQMKRLLTRRSVQVSLEEAEKEMGGRTLSLGDVEAMLKDGGVEVSADIAKRIASDATTRYLYVNNRDGKSSNTSEVTQSFNPNKPSADTNSSDSEIDDELKTIEDIYVDSDDSDCLLKNLNAAQRCMVENSDLSQEQILAVIKEQSKKSTSHFVSLEEPSTSKQSQAYEDLLNKDEAEEDSEFEDFKVRIGSSQESECGGISYKSEPSRRNLNDKTQLSNKSNSVVRKEHTTKDESTSVTKPKSNVQMTKVRADILKSLNAQLKELSQPRVKIELNYTDKLVSVDKIQIESDILKEDLPPGEVKCSVPVPPDIPPVKHENSIQSLPNTGDKTEQARLSEVKLSGVDNIEQANVGETKQVEVEEKVQARVPMIKQARIDETEHTSVDKLEQVNVGETKQIEVEEKVQARVPIIHQARIDEKEHTSVDKLEQANIGKTEHTSVDTTEEVEQVGVISSSDSDSEFIDVPSPAGSLSNETTLKKDLPCIQVQFQSKEICEDDMFADVFTEVSENQDRMTETTKCSGKEHVETVTKSKELGAERTVRLIPKLLVSSSEQESVEDESEPVRAPYFTESQRIKNSDDVNEIMESSSNNQKHQENVSEPKLSSTDLRKFQNYLENQEDLLLAERGKEERVATTITEQMYIEAQELLQLFGVPYVVAPMEAEAQCAFLDSIGLTQGTITDDSDIWLFGGRKVYKNFFSQNQYVLQFQSDDIQHFFKLARAQLVLLALLVGSDYTVGVQGVGPVTALEILASFPPPSEADGTDVALLLTSLEKFKQWLKSPPATSLGKKLKDVHLQPGFPSTDVVKAYLYPTVDESTETFSWGTPDLDALREFAGRKFGWNKSRCDSVLLPVMKKLAEKNSQRTLNDYFRLMPNIPAHREQMSVRVQRAIQRIGGGGGDIEPVISRRNTTRGSSVPRGRGRGRGRCRGRGNEEEPVRSHVRERSEHEPPPSPPIGPVTYNDEFIPQREQDRLDALKRKMKAIEVMKGSKTNRYGKKRNIRLEKKEAELSESSSEGEKV